MQVIKYNDFSSIKSNNHSWTARHLCPLKVSGLLQNVNMRAYSSEWWEMFWADQPWKVLDDDESLWSKPIVYPPRSPWCQLRETPIEQCGPSGTDILSLSHCSTGLVLLIRQSGPLQDRDSRVAEARETAMRGFGTGHLLPFTVSLWHRASIIDSSYA